MNIDSVSVFEGECTRRLKGGFIAHQSDEARHEEDPEVIVKILDFYIK
ncbi:hypothetical protein AAO61_001039 [Salmonella bongori]|nr:hypothetical protein [Salmonella bongori]